jgi:hypothetical protein
MLGLQHFDGEAPADLHMLDLVNATECARANEANDAVAAGEHPSERLGLEGARDLIRTERARH